jgi:transposase InsO family protein
MSTSNKQIISDNLERHMLLCVLEYEAIKNKTSKHFHTVGAFYSYHQFSRQNFLKIYNRYKQNPDSSLLVPQKRGPKFRTRRTDISVENRVIELRRHFHNRQTIVNILRSEGIQISSATVQNILKRHKLNKLSRIVTSPLTEKRRIVVSRDDKIYHIDLHQLSKGITIQNNNHTYYLLGLLDAYSRIAWVEVLEDKKALNVMFAALKSFNLLRLEYGLECKVVISDNGSEFGAGPNTQHKEEHPFERLLLEMDIKHRYTKPYRPQTNGKIERF